MDSNWCFQVHLPQILKGEDLLRGKNNFETVDQSNPTPLTPPKTNGWNLKIIPFFKGDSSEPNLHDFGFKMLVFRAVNCKSSFFCSSHSSTTKPSEKKEEKH